MSDEAKPKSVFTPRPTSSALPFGWLHRKNGLLHHWLTKQRKIQKQYENSFYKLTNAESAQKRTNIDHIQIFE